jgi:hypothetical protein
MRPFHSASIMAACLVLVFLSSGAEARAGVPQGARLSLELDKKTWFLGENVLIHLVVENTGNKPFTIDMGGDYRGATRALRFSVEATGAQGKAVPDPNPKQNCFGGLGYSKEIKPGDRHYESLQLLRYRRFDRPGKYRLKVSHDFGWKDLAGARPVAEATIEFVMPTPRQARQVVAAMYKLPKDHGGTAGEKRKPFADFSTLIYPVYLPVLAPKARQGDERALAALGAMPSPKATAELVGLLEHTNPAFARKALQTLNSRLPDPMLEKKLPGRNVFEIDFLHHRRWLVKESWRDEHAPKVRRIGRRLLAEKDVPSLNCGAYILECLGKQDDLVALEPALGRAALMAKDRPLEKGIYPRPRGACMELMRAARAMIQRGVKVNETPSTAGELLLFSTAIRWREKFRPAGWEKAFVAALRHELPFVRETALEALPLPPPKAVRVLLPFLVVDSDVDVQIAACHLAEKLKAPELREPVLKVLRTAREHWQIDAASRAALALGAPRERLRILVSRLDEEEVAARCLGHLVDSVLTSTGGYGSPTKLETATGRACKKEWQRFLGKHIERLAEGKKFKLSDPGVPLAKLFPGYKFEGR